MVIFYEVTMITDVYIGFDDREPLSYKVCEYSIKKHSPNVKIHPLIQSELRAEGIYSRRKDELASTQFSFTRFLVPKLQNFKGTAIFMDSDMLLTRSLTELDEIIDPKYAVSVVKHDYVPKGTVKMDNQVQRPFPKKNWSSFIVYNCSHPYNKQLTHKLVNEASPKFLHCFEWLTKHDIGGLPLEFNYLIGEYPPWKPTGIPFNLHWTLGSPELVGNDVEYADLWHQYYREATNTIPITGKVPEVIVEGEPIDVPLYPSEPFIGPQRVQPASVAQINAQTNHTVKDLSIMKENEKTAEMWAVKKN